MSRLDRRAVSGYFAAFIIVTGFGDPTGLISVPALFILKDQLHFGPGPVAIFETLILIPHYAAVLFGALRDRWCPLRLGDRGYFLLAAPVAAAVYFWMAIGNLGYGSLLAALMVAMIAYQMIDTSLQALMTAAAQRHLMTGRLSALTELSESVALLAAAFAGGWMVGHSSARTIFLVAACVSLVVFAMGFLKPAAVFGVRNDEPMIEAGLGQTWHHLRRIWPVVGILMLYNFSPGWGTPLFYFLTEHLHLSPELYGTTRAATFAGNAAATAAYGIVCVRYPLKRLLWWAVLLNLAPGALFLVVRLPYEVVAVSAALGFLAGFANVALFDLLMRSCPESFEGSISMMGVSAFGIAAAIGDIAGAWLYQEAGFSFCVLADALATLLVIPLLLKLPHAVISLKEGEAQEVAVKHMSHF